MADSPNSDFSFAALTGNTALIDQTLTRVFQSLSRNIRTGSSIRIGDISQTIVQNLVPLLGARVVGALDGAALADPAGGSVTPATGTSGTSGASGSPLRTISATARDGGNFLSSQEQIAARILKALLRGKRNM